MYTPVLLCGTMVLSPMTLPNKLTLSRLVSSPMIFFTWYLTIYHGIKPEAGIIIIWSLFIVSEITDLLDGYLARKLGQVSDLGRIMDPFFDVFLRLTCFICFVTSNLMPVWTLAVIIWRELGIIFIRILLIREKIALGANFLGKLKSTLYFFCSFTGFLCLSMRVWNPDSEWLALLTTGLSWMFIAAAMAALLSLLIYLRSLLKAGVRGF